MTQQPGSPGTKRERDGATQLEFTRTFEAPIEQVWAAVTDPERLARWVGTWTGDPAEGEVMFRMGFEGEEAEPECMQIEECEPPRRLRLVSTVGNGEGEPKSWHLALELSEHDGVTTLVFAQEVPDPELVESVGPGWQFYLDRLVAAETGGDVSAVVWEDYYPTLADRYRDAFS